MSADQRAQFQPKRIILGALAGGALAAVANTALFLLLNAVGVDFIIQADPTAPAAAIAVANFVVASFLPALLAGGVLLLLGRFTTKASGAFVVIASVFALLSLAGPATVGGASAGTRVALIAMHLLSAVLIAGALVRSASTTAGATSSSSQRLARPVHDPHA